MRPGELLAVWGERLFDGLEAAGVRDVVLSPGSRSTPFVAAALDRPGLRRWTLIDERDAAYFAVGHARMTGRPVVLVCTSGTAAANYFPAVVEAARAGVPLVVLTADRPLELQGSDANQTVDQVKLFGDHARAYIDLGTPDPHPAMLRALPRLAAQAVHTARWPLPGPVQINARARKPLEPEPLHGDRPGEPKTTAGAATAFAPESAPSAAAIEALAAACRSAGRGLIVCGPAEPWRAADPEAVAALARATGFPVVAEPASQQRFTAHAAPGLLDAFAALLGAPSFRDGYGPDLVIQLGRPPTASEWTPYLERWPEARRWVVAESGWPDPWGTATGLVNAPVDATARALARALSDPGDGGDGDGRRSSREDWAGRLRAANDVARDAIEASLDGGFSEGAVVRRVIGGLASGAVLALGNSLPIREADLFGPVPGPDVRVWSQRGASGIDGVVAGAAGAAAATGRPTTLLIGDVSLAHDIGGLAAARMVDGPLTIVVLNNGGGRIFERLPIAAELADDPRFDAWLTPPALDIASAAAAYGIPHRRAGSLDDLDAALADRPSGALVVEAALGPDATTAHQRSLAVGVESHLRP